MRRKMIFADRFEAGRLLAGRISELQLSRPIVLALPRGGVPVGAEIAVALSAPLGIAFVRKIGAPGEPELAIGAIADGPSPEIVLNSKLVQALALDEDYITAEATRELGVIERRRRDYEDLLPTVELAGRAIIVVDDGAATGMTMQAALRSVRRRRPARLIASAPVASQDAAAILRQNADVVVCLSIPRHFGAVGAYYRCFTQITDEDVARLLHEAASRASD